ncbi:MAG TPA: hypothetical protein VIC26_05010 [Marinagarivorans sp.]
MHQFTDEDTTMSAMQCACQASIVARAARQLIECRSFESFLCCAHKTLCDLGCSGFAQFQFRGESRRLKFGKTPRSNQHAVTAKPVVEINQCDGRAELTYRCERVCVVIDTGHYRERDYNILKNNVVVFCESMSAWLNHHSALVQERIDAVSEKINVVNNLNNFTRCLYRINDHLLHTQRHIREDLLTQLVSTFPVLGLHADQENKILDIVNAAVDQENQLLSSQIQQNIELRTLIERTIKALSSTAPVPPVNGPATDTSSAMLFG